jgi:hypothetical protein
MKINMLVYKYKIYRYRFDHSNHMLGHHSAQALTNIVYWVSSITRDKQNQLSLK